MKKAIRVLISSVVMLVMVLTLSGCNTDISEIVGNAIQLIDGNDHTKSALKNAIDDKWKQYKDNLDSLYNNGLITSSTSYEKLKKAKDESYDKFIKALINQSGNKADSDLCNHIIWFRTMPSIVRIYNALSMQYCIALMKDTDFASADHKSDEALNSYSKYGANPSADIIDRLNAIKVIKDLKAENYTLFGGDWDGKYTAQVTEETECKSTPAFNESKLAGLNSKYNQKGQDNNPLCVWKSWVTEEEHTEGYDEQGNPITHTDYTRHYQVFQRADITLGAGITDTLLRSAVTQANNNIIPIFTDADIPTAVAGNNANTGYKIFGGNGTNSGSNDIDINVVKYRYIIDPSNTNLIKETNAKIQIYKADESIQENADNILKTGLYQETNERARTDDVYLTTDFRGYEDKLKEDNIISHLSSNNATMDTNKINKDFIVELGGVPIMGIRLNELNQQAVQIVGEGVANEQAEGYMVINATSDDGQGKKRCLIPTTMYISYIKEIDNQGNFSVEKSQAQYDIANGRIIQKDSGIGDDAGKILADKYDIGESFKPLQDNTLLCLQYFGLFRNDDIAEKQWFPVGRSFRLKKENINTIGTNYNFKDIKESLGYWENTQGEFEARSSNAIYLYDLCDESSYDDDGKVYVLEADGEVSNEIKGTVEGYWRKDGTGDWFEITNANPTGSNNPTPANSSQDEIINQLAVCGINNSSNIMKVGGGTWLQDSSGNYYYGFNLNGTYYKLTGGWFIDSSDTYNYVNSNGQWEYQAGETSGSNVGWKQKSGKWYFYKTPTEYLKSTTATIDGIEYIFNANGTY